MTTPTVSLVIPAYNEAKYIGQCLEYVLGSGGKFFEIIVIDNASADATGEIAKKFPGVRVVREEKKGPSFARQRGFLEARGDLIAFIDADTQMARGWYEMIIEEFTNDSDVVCLSGPHLYYDIPTWQKALVQTYWYGLALPSYMIVRYMAIFGNLVIKKDTLTQMKGVDTSIVFYGDDTDIARRAYQFGKVKFKPSFIMYASGRRLMGQGLFRTGFLYASNFISEVVLHRPVTHGYTEIR